MRRKIIKLLLDADPETYIILLAIFGGVSGMSLFIDLKMHSEILNFFSLIIYFTFVIVLCLFVFVLAMVIYDERNIQRRKK
jgi:hypothetical protein